MSNPSARVLAVTIMFLSSVLNLHAADRFISRNGEIVTTEEVRIPFDQIAFTAIDGTLDGRPLKLDLGAKTVARILMISPSSGCFQASKNCAIGVVNTQGNTFILTKAQGIAYKRTDKMGIDTFGSSDWEFCYEPFGGSGCTIAYRTANPITGGVSWESIKCRDIRELRFSAVHANFDAIMKDVPCGFMVLKSGPILDIVALEYVRIKATTGPRNMSFSSHDMAMIRMIDLENSRIVVDNSPAPLDVRNLRFFDTTTREETTYLMFHVVDLKRKWGGYRGFKLSEIRSLNFTEPCPTFSDVNLDTWKEPL